jgi:uncharacterized membrane protein YczE
MSPWLFVLAGFITGAACGAGLIVFILLAGTQVRSRDGRD